MVFFRCTWSPLNKKAVQIAAEKCELNCKSEKTVPPIVMSQTPWRLRVKLCKIEEELHKNAEDN